MTIEFACVDCNTTLKAPDKYIGKKSRCTKCGVSVVVPPVSEALVVATPRVHRLTRKN